DSFIAQFKGLVEAQLGVLNKNWEELEIEELPDEKEKPGETERKQAKRETREPLKGFGDLFR
ncbi:unnamed protein product, partial [marine sediment metagenome]